MSGLHAALTALLADEGVLDEATGRALREPHEYVALSVAELLRLLAEHPAEGTERVEYVIDWLHKGPHPTQITGVQSTRDTLDEALDFASWSHVYNAEITKRTTVTTIEPVEVPR